MNINDFIISFLLTICVFTGLTSFMIAKGWISTPYKKSAYIPNLEVDLQHESELLKRMATLAFPETNESMPTRDLSSWNNAPLEYNEKLISKMSLLAVPN